jgi:SAM-dependent methyltransferase
MCERSAVTDSSAPTSYEINRASWDERAPAHAASPDYGFERFAGDPMHLSSVVEFDRPRIGELAGLRGVHLQCHIGTDTISLSRLGARMTGLDFSPAAIAEARRLVERTGDEVDFVESTVYDALDVLEAGSFDLVFTGIGALCWLPDIRQWAQVVADLLRPGGRLFIREGHPMLWAIDERHTDRLVIDYPYFERPEPIPWEDDSTYVETDVVFKVNLTHSWNHGLGEILTAVMESGMTITSFEEHDSVPWDALPGQMERLDNGEYRLADRPWRLPASYTLQAVKPT